MSLPAPYYDHAGITIYHADCKDILPHLGKFDLLLTDPPYGLGEKLRKRNPDDQWTLQHEPMKWDEKPFNSAELCNWIEAHGESIIWGGNYYALPPKRGWLSWDKMQEHTSGHFELAWTTLDMPTRCFRKSRVEAYSKMGKHHPTQKPVELISWCIGLAGDVQTILDPFAGSGTTGRAAKDLGKQCVMIEREERYCEIAAERMSQKVLALF